MHPLVFPTVNSAIIEFQKKKKLVKGSAFFCIIQKISNRRIQIAILANKQQEKKIPLHVVHAPRLLNIYYVYTTAIA